MDNSPFFSIVMPVYNVEKYLGEAVKSITEQTFDDFELILVDDCSPDASGKICDELSDGDDRFKVIHLPKNGGLSNARNVGIDNSTGKYIFFMDSDDIIDSNLFKLVYESLQKNTADVVVFGLEEDYFDKNGVLSKKYVLTYGKELLLNDTEDVRAEVIHLEDKTFYGYAWNKFFNLEKIKEAGARFENITLIEDILFNVTVFYHVNSLNILNIAPYHYMKRINGSLTNKFVPDYFKLHNQRVQMIYDQYIQWNKCTDEVKTILANIYARYIFSAMQRNCDKRSGMSKKDRRLWLSELFSEELFNELLPYMNSSGLLGIIEKFLINKNAFLCLFMGKLIYIVKEKLPIIFASAKQSRK